MSDFHEKKSEEGFEEVPMTSSEQLQVQEIGSSSQLVEAVNVSKYEDKSGVEEEEEEGNTSSSVQNVVPVSQLSNGWNVVSGWMKKGAEKVQKVTNDTVEATAPARSQFYDLSMKVAADIAPASRVMTDVAGSTLSVVSDAIVSTSEIVSTSLNNASQELSEFASEMQNGPPATETSNEEPNSKPTNMSV